MNQSWHHPITSKLCCSTTHLRGSRICQQVKTTTSSRTMQSTTQPAGHRPPRCCKHTTNIYCTITHGATLTCARTTWVVSIRSILLRERESFVLVVFNSLVAWSIFSFLLLVVCFSFDPVFLSTLCERCYPNKMIMIHKTCLCWLWFTFCLMLQSE